MSTQCTVASEVTKQSTTTTTTTTPSVTKTTTHRVDFSTLLPNVHIEAAVKHWIHDDMPSFDVGGLVVGNDEKTATLWMKSAGVVAGLPFVQAVFDHLNCKVEWEGSIQEGQFLEPQTKMKIATVTGPVSKILQGERTALNTMSRCSGVATASRQAVEVARLLQWKGWVAGTRKTTPGFRIVEKYGLLIGGAATHRLDLSQMVMLKDNHIWAAGNITSAVKLARQAAGFSQKIEVECQSVEEAVEAANAGADIVMLDNFEPDQLKLDAAHLKHLFPHLLIEASGGITTETMADYLSEHVDIVSQGKLTQGYPCIDFSLKLCGRINFHASSMHSGSWLFATKMKSNVNRPANAGADIVLLDNYKPDQLKEFAAHLKHLIPHLLTEASSGMTTESRADYLSEHADIVSQGKLTQGYPCIDFSLKIDL